MTSRSSSAGAIAAAVLLLLPILYVGSYYAVVDTDDPTAAGVSFRCSVSARSRDLRYRIYPEVAGVIYWPIEQVDRRLRPAAWEDPLIKMITSTIVPEGWHDITNYPCKTGEASASAP